MSDELKSCPFCGSDILELDRHYGKKEDWYVTCYSCPCQGVQGGLTREQAIEKWNNRTNPKEDKDSEY